MSDPLHLDKVRAGAAVWNKWRRDNPGIVPDLNGLRISASELQFGIVQGGPVDFSRTELAQALLVHATLIEANLAGSVLVKADLSYGRLSKADLRGADLRGAKLAHADLTDARLDGAFVCGADLRHARGLTQQQIDRALGGEDTLLPADLEVPTTWLAEDERERQRPGGRDIDALVKAYELLGVKPKASMQEIRTAWLRLVKELHPDIAADDPSATERLKVINRAYQGLKSLEQRELAKRAQRRASSGAATFAVFLCLPIATTLAVAVWTHGLPALQQNAAVATVTEPKTDAGEPARAVASEPTRDADEARVRLALGYPPNLPSSSAKDSAPAKSAPERSHQASDDDAAPASVVAEVKHGAHDAAAMQRRSLEEHPTAELAGEARSKLAALEASAAADVAKSGRAAKDDDRKVPEPSARELNDTSTHRALASAEAADRERAESAIAWSDGRQQGGAQEPAEKESIAAYLQTRRNGHKTDIARAMITEPVQAAKPITAGSRQQGARPARPSASVAHSANRWPSADEPFVAADGRIR